MKLKSEAHESLSIIFKRDSVPPKSFVDISKDQSLGKFSTKCHDADCHLVTTDPPLPMDDVFQRMHQTPKVGFVPENVKVSKSKATVE